MQRIRGLAMPNGLTDLLRPIGLIGLLLALILALIFGVRGCVRGEDAVEAYAQGGGQSAATSEGGAAQSGGETASDDGSSWDEEAEGGTVADATPDPDAKPTPKPTKKLTNLTQSELDEVKLLPLINRYKSVKGKVVAITVDDCFQVDSLKKILKLAEKYDAKLTFYPKGSEVAKNAKLWKQIYDHGGYQIGNHTFNHKNVSKLTDDEIREEITKASDAINQAIGMNYHMTSFRCPTGDGKSDPRLHKILRELGYENVAMWGLSGSQDVTKIMAGVQKGDIILFHSKASDLAKLKKVIPQLKKKGYKMVTVNELYGKPADTVTALDATGAADAGAADAAGGAANG